MTDNKNKILVNLIKADLQDVLTNDGRWKLSGSYCYFQDYIESKDIIFVHSDNLEIKKELEKNKTRNWDSRMIRWEKEEKEWNAKHNEPYAKYSTAEKSRLENFNIYTDELEKADSEKIISLIQQVKNLERQKNQQKQEQTKKKLNDQPGLFYWNACGSSTVISKNMREYYGFESKENGQVFYLKIAKNHPALANFSFREEWFCLIPEAKNIPIERAPANYWSDGGENNPCNFSKYVEIGDKITIVPFKSNSEALENKNKKIGFCNKCNIEYENTESWYYPLNKEGKSSWEKLDWFCGKCWQWEEKNYRQKTSRENTVHKSEPKKFNLGDEHSYYFENGRWISLESGTPDPNTINIGDKSLSIAKLFEKETDKYLNSNKSVLDLHISFLVSLFQSWNIKSIELTNLADVFSDLIITYNGGKREIQKYAAPDGDENNLIRKALKTINEKSLDRTKLEKLQTSTHSPKNTSEKSQPKKTDYIPYLIGGGVIIAVSGVIFWVIYRRGRKKKK